jgi:phosphatidylethanolamine-binding protein (PEBP) family uncharacterized protein
LRCSTPDAPGGAFTHWLVYGLPAGIASLPAVPANAAEGINDFGRRGYGGPARRGAPRATTTSWVLALDTRLDLAPGATRPGLEQRISGHVLGRGDLAATCQRA